jgi:hypothetical protein
MQVRLKVKEGVLLEDKNLMWDILRNKTSNNITLALSIEGLYEFINKCEKEPGLSVHLLRGDTLSIYTKEYGSMIYTEISSSRIIDFYD